MYVYDAFDGDCYVMPWGATDIRVAYFGPATFQECKDWIAEFNRNHDD